MNLSTIVIYRKATGKSRSDPMSLREAMVEMRRKGGEFILESQEVREDVSTISYPSKSHVAYMREQLAGGEKVVAIKYGIPGDSVLWDVVEIFAVDRSERTDRHIAEQLGWPVQKTQKLLRRMVRLDLLMLHPKDIRASFNTFTCKVTEEQMVDVANRDRRI